MRQLPQLWRGVFRIVVGIYWLYFASTKWSGVGWMRPLVQSAYSYNPIPGLHEILQQVVAPNWYLFAIGQTVAETLVAVLLILGLATRWAAVLGFLLALNLALVVAFEYRDVGFRWLYYLAVMVNAELIFAGVGWPALGGYRFVPAWLRS